MKLWIVWLVLLGSLSLHGAERLVTLSPSLTEILFALDVGEHIVGVSQYSDFPEAAKKIARIGGYSNPDLEKILQLHPSLVIGQHYSQQLLAKLEHFHINTLMLRLETLQEITQAIRTLGKRFHKEHKAAQLIAAIDTAATTVLKAATPSRVLIVYGLSDDLRRNNYVAAPGIFFDDIIHICGHENAFTPSLLSQPVLSYENIIALNPDQIVILHSHRTESDVNATRALNAWQQLPINAAKRKKIHIVDESYIHIPSHRVAQSITRLCEELNGD